MKPHRNRGLFSSYYLDELLPKEDEFKISISEVKSVHEKVKAIWDKSRFEALNEPQLRKHLLDKVFEILGWIIDVEPPTPSGEWSKRPDYALFYSKEDLKIAQKATEEEYFKKSPCIGEAKRWGRPLDRKLKEEKDPFEVQNPSLQISRYLWLTGVKWGILTDGKYWRLYERETSKRLDIFYEIDFEELIESGTPKDFRYFYFLFRKDAFPEFIEKVYKGSVDYAEGVGEELKENIYQALKILAQGFLKTPGNTLSQENLKEIHDNSLILLYRILFILYAEYRSFLPFGDNKLYTKSYSLDALKKEVAGRLDRNEPIAASTPGYWNKLKELFEIIDIGNSELGVPPYNGGLFDPGKHKFLEKYRVGDFYTAKAVDLLSRSSKKAYIDYGSLDIRHLGSIYEGLLEYKLKIAEEDIVPIKEKSREIFVSLEEAQKTRKKIKEEEIIRKGEVYLITDKGERKATGSYYTPDYIVSYIIDNTLSPLLNRIKQETTLAKEIKNGARYLNEVFEEIIADKEEDEAKNLSAFWKLTKSIDERKDFLLNMLDGPQPRHKYELIERILQMKVLDPAMGSGHFLVEATTFLARALIEALGESPEEVGEDEIRWARREVVERCIFGVDFNPLAVELAKLSLWLSTVAKGKPLNFLDHHLKSGNSLLGVHLGELKTLPKEKDSLQAFDASTLTQNLAHAVNLYLRLQKGPTETIEDVKTKANTLDNLNRMWLDSWRDVANLWMSTYFGIDLHGNPYRVICTSILKEKKEPPKIWREKYTEPAAEIAKKKNFFHWELEFPEIFYDQFGHPKENPGFDVVVGNPPYGVTFDNLSKAFFKDIYGATEYQFESFSLFIEKALMLLKQRGFQSYITPTTWLSQHYFENLRGILLGSNQLRKVIFFKEPVFKDATVETCIEVAEKDKPDLKSVLMLGVVYDKPDNLSINWTELKQKEIEKFEGKRITEYLTEDILNLFGKVSKNSISLKQIALIIVGCKPYQGGKGFPPQTKEIVKSRLFDGDYKIDDTYKPYLRGEDFYKYDLNPQESRWISYGEWLAEPRPSAPFFVDKKIIIRQTADSVIATIDDKQYLNLNNVHNLVLKAEGYSLEFILSLLNSKFLSFMHRMIVPEFGRVFAEIKIVNLEKLPVHRVSFVTPKVHREQLVGDGKNYYKQYLETGQPDTILHFIKSRLVKEYETNAGLVKKHNFDPLNKDFQIPEGALWEQSDVVHNILAFLVEQMIEMNKEKQKEIKGFLVWLESQLKIEFDTERNKGIDMLTGKSQIKNYLGDYQKRAEHLSFNGFWSILEKNKNRIHTNLKSRELYEIIKSEYEKSLSKLLPLKEKLRKTDWLIDQIVYKLYGLSEEEIKIVEGQR